MSIGLRYLFFCVNCEVVDSAMLCSTFASSRRGSAVAEAARLQRLSWRGCDCSRGAMFRLSPQAGEAHILVFHQKSKKVLFVYGSRRVFRFRNAVFGFRLKPARLFLFAAPKRKQKALFANGSLGTAATIATAHTRLFGRSNSRSELCSRARVTVCLALICSPAFEGLGTSTTSDTVRTHLFGHSDLLCKSRGRARVTVGLRAGLCARNRRSGHCRNDRHGVYTPLRAI